MYAIVSLLWRSELAQAVVSLLLVLVVCLGGPVEFLKCLGGIVLTSHNNTNGTTSTITNKNNNNQSKQKDSTTTNHHHQPKSAMAATTPPPALKRVVSSSEATSSPRRKPSSSLQIQDATPKRLLATPESSRTDAAVIHQQQQQQPLRNEAQKEPMNNREQPLDHSSRRDDLALAATSARPKYGRALSETIRATAAAARDMSASRRHLLHNSSMQNLEMSHHSSSRHGDSGHHQQRPISSPHRPPRKTSKYPQVLQHHPSAAADLAPIPNPPPLPNHPNDVRSRNRNPPRGLGDDQEESLHDVFAAFHGKDQQNDNRHDDDDGSEGSLDLFAIATADQFNSDPNLLSRGSSNHELNLAAARRQPRAMSKSDTFLDFNDSFHSGGAHVRTARTSSSSHVRSISSNLQSKMKRHVKMTSSRQRHISSSKTRNHHSFSASMAHHSSQHYQSGMAKFNQQQQQQQQQPSRNNSNNNAPVRGGHSSLRNLAVRTGGPDNRSRYSSEDQRILQRLYAPEVSSPQRTSSSRRLMERKNNSSRRVLENSRGSSRKLLESS